MSKAFLSDKLCMALNKEYVRRLLIKYFIDKGIKENFDKKIYPPVLQDLILNIPQLRGKIEIQPFVEDIDPNSGTVKLGWNLFVLGTSRMYLGESTHTSLQEISASINGPLEGGRICDYATPHRIIKFIVSVLGDSKNGIIPSSRNAGKTTLSANMGDHSGYFRSSQRPVS